MGEVWLAEDPTGASGGAPRRVALKLLDPTRVDDPDARARFAREVEAARRVTGPTIAALLDADVDAPQPWLASAYVAGPTLADHVTAHGALGDVALRALGSALAEALVAIHAAGVVHRDLTPRNVVLGPDGPRVVDFGIAWYDGAASITQTGARVGTPSWMAPERLTHDEVTASGDVWSWGAVMAYAALGYPAVGGSGPEVVAAPHHQGRRRPGGRAGVAGAVGGGGDGGRPRRAPDPRPPGGGDGRDRGASVRGRRACRRGPPAVRADLHGPAAHGTCARRAPPDRDVARPGHVDPLGETVPDPLTGRDLPDPPCRPPRRRPRPRRARRPRSSGRAAAGPTGRPRARPADLAAPVVAVARPGADRRRGAGARRWRWACGRACWSW